MKEFSKLRQQQKAETEQEQILHGQQQGQEFSSVEEMLRHDAKQTPVPPNLETRLSRSAVGLAPQKKQSWWQKFFS